MFVYILYAGGSVLDKLFILVGKFVWFILKFTLYVLTTVVIMAMLLDGGYLG